MKNALIIAALTLSTVTAFAGTKVSKEARKEARKVAVTACKAEGKTKKELKSCVKAKLHATTAAVSEVAPATEAPAK